MFVQHIETVQYKGPYLNWIDLEVVEAWRQRRAAAVVPEGAFFVVDVERVKQCLTSSRPPP